MPKNDTELKRSDNSASVIPNGAVVAGELATHARLSSGGLVSLAQPEAGLIGFLPVFSSEREAAAMHGKDCSLIEIESAGKRELS